MRRCYIPFPEAGKGLKKRNSNLRYLVPNRLPALDA